jgi:hypothetical protein
MDWIFEGIGTMLVGVLLGVGGCTIVRRIRKNRVSQRQKGSSGSAQYQAGRDLNIHGDESGRSGG